MVKREIYSVGLKRKVEADVDEIIATPSRGGGFRYQVVGFLLMKMARSISVNL